MVVAGGGGSPLSSTVVPVWTVIVLRGSPLAFRTISTLACPEHLPRPVPWVGGGSRWWWWQVVVAVLVVLL